MADPMVSDRPNRNPPLSGQPPAGGTQQPNLPPVTVEKPITRVRRAAPAKPTPQAPPTVVSRPGPTPRGAQRPRQVPVPAQAPIAPPSQSLFGGLIPAGAISASFVPQVAPGVPGPNLNAIATSATRLDLPLRETPASVDVITQQTMQEQGYRTNVEAAQGAVGVLAINGSAAQGGFMMRGFSGDAINHLYNGINIGNQDLTGRTQDTFSFDRIEFLKGASAIESGIGSIGGSVVSLMMVLPARSGYETHHAGPGWARSACRGW